MIGHPVFQDTSESYEVTLDPVTHQYFCQCFTTYHGDTREHKLCSHILLVIIAKKMGLVKNIELGGEEEVEEQHFPTPSDFGLPDRFRQYRPVQVDALEQIEASTKKVILLQAPTGSGKSLIAATHQRIVRKPILYTCHTKTLQDQFTADFGKLNDGRMFSVELKGKENYPTAYRADEFPRINCSLCTKTKKVNACAFCCPPKCYKEYQIYGPERCEDCRHAFTHCPYHIQKIKALNAPIAVLNMAMFLNEANYVGQFGVDGRPGGKWPWIVLDEGDETEEALMSFVELPISARIIDKLQLEHPKYKTKLESWIEWAEQHAIPSCNRMLEEIEEKKEKAYTLDLDLYREGREMDRLQKRLDTFVREVRTGNWVNCTERGHEETGPWVFKPVFVSKFAQKYLWRHAERFLVMSATIISKEQFCSSLGVDENDCEFIDMPSTFPKENRPVYLIPKVAITHKNKEQTWPVAVEQLDKVLDLYPDKKGLIHTVSYELTRYVLEHSRHIKRMINYASAKERDSIIQRFKKSPEPLLIVAPSLDRGVDFPDDLCRVVVIIKVPYPSLADMQVKTRLYSASDGEAWYAMQTARSIVQMTGRGVRHQNDTCDSWIVDGQFVSLYHEWKKMFPEYWRDAYQIRPGV